MTSSPTIWRPPHLATLAALLCLPVLTFAQYADSPAPSRAPQSARPSAPAGEAPDWSDDIPAHIALVDGVATLDRDGQADAAVENVALLAGDRLHTERGRAEVLFADGSALDLDQNSSVDFLSDSLVRLLAGRVRLTIVRAGGNLEYRVDASPASVLIRAAGDYRLELSRPQSEAADLDLAVLRGSAELENAFGRVLVRAGTHARASARAEPSLPYAFNSAAWDPFDRWAEDQRRDRFGAESSRYLPSDLRYYGGALDRDGSWDYESSYGYVWYPRVDATWRPYYSGRWSFVARLGWFWVGLDRWSWPTHHYGRWGLNANRWFWIPDRRWGPAWVSWASAPGYVSWCPLGFDGRPVVSVASASYWHGWTVFPSRMFGQNVSVGRYVVDGRQLSPMTRASLEVRATAPVLRDQPRTAAPLRSPGADTRTRAVPRDSTSPTFAPSAPSSRQREVPGNGTVGARSSPSGCEMRRVAPSRDDRAPIRSDGSRTVSPTNDAPQFPRAVPRAVDPPSSGPADRRYPSRTYDTRPPATQPSEPDDRRRGPATRPNTEPPGSERQPPRVAPRVEPPSSEREPPRAAPRGEGRVESPPPPPQRHDPPPAPSAGSRSRPSGSADDGKAVPRGRGRGTEH